MGDLDHIDVTEGLGVLSGGVCDCEGNIVWDHLMYEVLGYIEGLSLTLLSGICFI